MSTDLKILESLKNVTNLPTFRLTAKLVVFVEFVASLVHFSGVHSLESRPLEKYRQFPFIMLFIQTDGEILSNLQFSLFHAFTGHI